MLVRRIARPLLAGIFIQGGISELRDTAAHVRRARPVLDAVTEAVPTDPVPPDVMVRLDAAVKIGAGMLLALGKAPRLAAAALAASLVPTTLASHRFWAESDPEARAEQRIHFMKNLGLLGGLVIASADTAGKPSLAWRGRRTARRAAAETGRVVASATGAETGGKITGTAAALTGAAASTASRVTAKADKKAATLTMRAAKVRARAARKATRLKRVAAAHATRLADVASARSAELAHAAPDRLALVADQARRTAGTLADRASADGQELSRSVRRLERDVARRVADVTADVSRRASAAKH